MTMRKQTMLALVAAAGILVAAGAAAADIEAGRAKAKEVCAACHGEDGNSKIPDYPKLSGQHSDYLAKALRDYKSGSRKNAIMAPLAGTLTKADIENLAGYFHAQPAALATGQ
jgi:cytochrome c553